jgi:hypothetical protein
MRYPGVAEGRPFPFCHGQLPRRAAAGGPAIRCIDMRLPGPFNYPPRKTDLLTAPTRVQRLRALMNVCDNRACIAAMQRRLSPGLLNSHLL